MLDATLGQCVLQHLSNAHRTNYPRPNDQSVAVFPLPLIRVLRINPWQYLHWPAAFSIRFPMPLPTS